MNNNVTKISEKISIKDLILKIQEWSLFFLKQKFVICLFGVIGGISGFIYATIQKTTYIAKTTFVLEEGKGSNSGIGGLASLAGQFGVDIGAGSGGGLLSGENILLYFKSPSLAREVLLSTYNSKTQNSIADKYIETYGLKRLWLKNDKVGDVKFPILSSNRTYTRLQDSLLQEIISTINTKQFHVAKTDKKAGFIDVVCNMQSESLSKVYCESIVQKVVERYIAIKTQRQNATVQKLQLRVDSISALLRQKTYSGALLQNSSNTMDINPLFRTGTTVAVETTIRDKTLLSTIFASVTQNLEMAKFTLSQETPVIQIVDSPILPLKIEKVSRLKATAIGSFVFIFLSLSWLSIMRIYKSIIQK